MISTNQIVVIVAIGVLIYLVFRVIPMPAELRNILGIILGHSAVRAAAELTDRCISILRIRRIAMYPKLFNILVAIGVLAMFVLSAGAPHTPGG